MESIFSGTDDNPLPFYVRLFPPNVFVKCLVEKFIGRTRSG
jgi:hypothetical protein